VTPSVVSARSSCCCCSCLPAVPVLLQSDKEELKEGLKAKFAKLQVKAKLMQVRGCSTSSARATAERMRRDGARGGGGGCSVEHQLYA
jgi:hypothetical protein